MKRSGFIAVHPSRGIYLGAFGGIGIFSNDTIAFSTKAIFFPDSDKILEFFQRAAPSVAQEIDAVSVDNTQDGYYIDVVDIIKSGYETHIDSMIDNLPTLTDTIH